MDKKSSLQKELNSAKENSHNLEEKLKEIEKKGKKEKTRMSQLEIQLTEEALKS